MKHFMVVVTLVAFLATGAAAQTVSGEITADTTWSGSITLTGDVTVTSGTLTIEAGTVVKFAAVNDNIVFGGAKTIYLTVMGAGVLDVNGTEGNRVTFTTANSLMPAKGAWGRILYVGLTNDAANVMQYANVEYSSNGISVENPSGNAAEPSAPTFVHVTITNCSGAGFSGNAGAAPTLRYCTIRDCNGGIWMHGTGQSLFEYCTVSNVPWGAAFPGNKYPGDSPVYVNTPVINHCTFHNVSLMLSSGFNHWDGYGIYTCNAPVTITVKNSIISAPTLNGVRPQATDTFTENNNCFFGGLGPIEGGTADGSSITDDPMFHGPESGDFSLGDPSPCKNAADDGTHIGAIQGGTGIFGRSGQAAFKVNLPSNPVTGNIVFVVPAGARLEVYNIQGNVITTRTAVDGRISWNAREDVQPGMYLYKVIAGNQVYQNILLVK